MQTTVRTPQSVFMMPQRLLVPLFQRPYVWNEELQWEPLWRDLERVATRSLEELPGSATPHFIGAVVVQSLATQVGDLTENIIIDGQQRLTTIQLMLDAIHAEALAVQAKAAAERLEPLIQNSAAFCKHPEDRFKVWPTNRDRPAFNEVMGAPPPIDHKALSYYDSRLVQAHEFFSHMARAFIRSEGESAYVARATALERAARDLLQMVVIQLSADENAQEIFETLNARGSLLTAADLIKNFIFQRLLEEGTDVERAYHDHWQHFETAFWETDVAAGRLIYQRSSLFLNQWLSARTGDDIVAREVFARFKRYASTECNVTMYELLEQIAEAARVHKTFVEASVSKHPSETRLELFAYRTTIMEAESTRIVVLWLLDPTRQKSNPISNEVLDRCWELLETWLVRRLLVRAIAKSMSRAMVELVRVLNANDRSRADEVIDAFIRGNVGTSMYLPDDEEVRSELRSTPTYKRIPRGRLRMILEAIEDELNGYGRSATALSANRVTKYVLTIEHLMPQQWATNWSAPSDGDIDGRELRIHQLGNLTLLRQALNSIVSNGPWAGATGKINALEVHGQLAMASKVIREHRESWTDHDIDTRTEELISVILKIWPVQEGYRSQQVRDVERQNTYVDLSDLLRAGLLKPGQKIVPISPSLAHIEAFITPDGSIEIGGNTYSTPSGAGNAVRNSESTNGWGFWLVDEGKRPSLHALRALYRRQMVLGGDVDPAELAELDGTETEQSEQISAGALWKQFWEGFIDYAKSNNAPFVTTAPLPQVWMNISIGKPGLKLNPIVTSYGFNQEKPQPEVRAEIVILDNYAWFDTLYAQRDDIEREYGAPLTWYKVEGVKQTKILDRLAIDVTDRSNWGQCYEWLVDKVSRMKVIIQARASQLT